MRYKTLTQPPSFLSRPLLSTSRRTCLLLAPPHRGVLRLFTPFPLPTLSSPCAGDRCVGVGGTKAEAAGAAAAAEAMGDHVARCDDFEKKAEEKLSGWGLFSSKYEDTANLFDKAANSFKLAKNCERSWLPCPDPPSPLISPI